MLVNAIKQLAIKSTILIEKYECVSCKHCCREMYSSNVWEYIKEG